MDQFLRNRLTNGNSSSTYVYVFDHKGPRSLSQLYGGGQSYYGTKFLLIGAGILD